MEALQVVVDPMEPVQITIKQPAIPAGDAPWLWLEAHPEFGVSLHAKPARDEKHIRLERSELETLRRALNYLLTAKQVTVADLTKALEHPQVWHVKGE